MEGLKFEKDPLFSHFLGVKSPLRGRDMKKERVKKTIEFLNIFVVPLRFSKVLFLRFKGLEKSHLALMEFNSYRALV